MAQPPEPLLVARRALEGLTGVSLLTDWSWSMAVHRWVLHLQLNADVLMGGSIPCETEWYILTDPTYPWGDIDIHPAKIGGIELTFPHQSHNSQGDPMTPWRQGKLCLSTGVRSLGRYGYDTEPLAAPNRLRWHVQRALAWLSAASRGDLAAGGDPFELPDFAIASPNFMIAFSESQESLCTWQAVVEQVGLADLAVFPARARPVRCCAFHLSKGAESRISLGVPGWEPRRLGSSRRYVCVCGCPCRTSLAIAANMEGTRVGTCAARY